MEFVRPDYRIEGRTVEWLTCEDSLERAACLHDCARKLRTELRREDGDQSSAYSSDDDAEEAAYSSDDDAEEEPIEPVEPKYINVRVKEEGEHVVCFKIMRKTRLQKVFEAYCECQSLQRAPLRFLFNGSQLFD